MELPGLLIDRNLGASLNMLQWVRTSDARNVVLDAHAVVSIEPVAACILGAAAKGCRAAWKTLTIRDLAPNLHGIVRSIDSQIVLDGPTADQGTLHQQNCIAAGQVISTVSEGNKAANAIADQIARFIPREDRDQMMLDEYGVLIHHAIQPALAHILSELVDNVFS